jgi:hypothetical protein
MAEQVAASTLLAIDDDQRQQLLRASSEEWVDRVRANDPRFRDVVPAYRGSLTELFDEALANPQGVIAITLADSLPGILRRIRELNSHPLDIALRHLLQAVGITDRNAAITIRRLGWGDDPPAKLQEIADDFGMTRERVRQVVSAVIRHIDPTYMPQLENAIKLIHEQAPIRADVAAELLVEQGIASVPLHPSGVASAAEVLGYEALFRVTNQDGVPYVTAPESACSSATGSGCLAFLRPATACETLPGGCSPLRHLLA